MIAGNLEKVHEHYVMGLSEEMGALNSTVKTIVTGYMYGDTATFSCFSFRKIQHGMAL